MLNLRIYILATHEQIKRNFKNAKSAFLHENVQILG